MPLILDENATCMGCGYRLANLPTQRCPECGRWFEPNDPTTYRNRWYLSGWRRWASAPSRKEILAIVALSAYGVIDASGPAQWEASRICMISIIGVPLWIGITFFYFRRLVACRRDRDRANLDEDTSMHWWRWVIAPLCTLVILSAFVYPWPLMLRFRLSHSAFEAAVKDYQAGRFTGMRWVGLYYVEHVDEITHANNKPPSIGFITGASFIDPVGFEYDPTPGHPMGFMVVRVAPSWYTYED